MLAFLITLASVFGYGFVGLVTTRIAYVREYKRYLTWKNEGGVYRQIRGHDSYSPPPRNQSRKDATYRDYRRSVSSTAPPGLIGAGWFIVLPSIAANKFVHPEVKAPDYHKISELENL